VKELLKSDSICESYAQMKKSPVFFDSVYNGSSEKLDPPIFTYLTVFRLFIHIYIVLSVFVTKPYILCRCQVDKAALQLQASAAHKRVASFDDLPASKLMRHASSGDCIKIRCDWH